MRHLWTLTAVFCIAMAATGVSAAKPFTEAQVPAPLSPWLPWVNHSIEHDGCPFIYDQVSQHACIWPTRLSLDLTAKGGSFSYSITVYDTPDKKPQHVLLPGRNDQWPQDVKLDGRPQTVLARDSRPGLLLKAGSYVFTGSFQWDRMPASISVPSEIGLVQLTVAGKEVAIPEMENEQLWIAKGQAEEQSNSENLVQVKLFRKVKDGIPLTLETSIDLQVAGKQREEELGKILPDGFIPLEITSDVPARLDNDGTLRAQLRPGTWHITINARAGEPLATLSLPAKSGILADQEIWSFEPASELRLVQIEGVNAIDPSQTDLPEEWRSLPAYLVKQGSHFNLTEKKRGMAQSVPDQLTLNRDIWLDFSGNGYTFVDSIAGTIRKSARLEVSDGVELGDATINGKEQFITQLDDKGGNNNSGVEVREGPLSMTAGSRIESGAEHFAATGWKSSFDNVSASLYLPPGWSLFSYSGVDNVSGSWIGRWSLLDIFFVLLAVAACAKLFGWRVAMVALLALILTEHELYGFTGFVLAILATVALIRHLPAGKLRHAIVFLQRGIMCMLIVLLLPFMVQHLRMAIYPQLDPAWAQRGSLIEEIRKQKQITNAALGGARPYSHAKEHVMAAGDLDGLISNAPVDQLQAVPMEAAQMPALPAVPQAMSNGFNKDLGRGRMLKSALGRAIAKKSNSFASNSLSNEDNYQQYAPDTKVQTGFGNATWRNNGITLRWSGVVDPSVTLKLCLISAKQNLMLAVLRIVLILWLLSLLLSVPAAKIGRFFSGHGRVALLLAASFFFMDPSAGMARARMIVPVLPPVPVSDEVASNPVSIAPAGALTSDLVFPPTRLLEELKNRLEQTLNRPPFCAPLCANVARTHFSLSGNTLILLQEVHASDNVAFPLPGNLESWRPTVVTVDDSPALGLKQGEGGYLYVNLPSGVHHVRMMGSLPSLHDTVGISLPVISHYSSFDAAGWGVQGVHENGLTDSSVELIRTQKQQVAGAPKSLEKSAIVPFFEVERSFTLAQQWLVSSTVRRITPAEEPAAVHIPLLKSETITTESIRVKDGESYIAFGPGESEVQWQSVIKPGATLDLVAAKGKPWVEIWRLSVSNLWHADVTGIPRVYTADQDAGIWQWQPWPGESVHVDVMRPMGVAGDTKTLDSSTMIIRPGERSMQTDLTLKLRSSLGGQHEIKLPQDVELLQVQQGNTTLPVQLKQDTLSLPLTPGENIYTVRWKKIGEFADVFTVPPVTPGVARSVNATVTIDLPANRWILFAWGPHMGPAVLFWSWIAVIMILAFALGRAAPTPLASWQWFLLLLGLSQSSLWADLVIITWLLALSWRNRKGMALQGKWRFNLLQIALVVLTLLAFCDLFDSIHTGLLNVPDMNIAGNNSYNNHLVWYQDITGSMLPRPLVISVSIWVYRGLMLLWSLWLAFSLVRWLRWGWNGFVQGGYWRSRS